MLDSYEDYQEARVRGKVGKMLCNENSQMQSNFIRTCTVSWIGWIAWKIVAETTLVVRTRQQAEWKD